MNLNQKAKLISLGLIAILVVPAFLLQVSKGNVLGVNQKSDNSKNSGSIAGGVKEVIELPKSEKNMIEGYAVLNDNQLNSVESSQFRTGSNLKVKSSNSIVYLEVQAISQFSENKTLLSLNKKTFAALGGSLITKNPIKIEITKE